MLSIHNLQTADLKLWRVRWSHQDGGDQNNLASYFGAYKQQVARSSPFFLRSVGKPYLQNQLSTPNSRACSELKTRSRYSIVRELFTQKSRNENVIKRVTSITLLKAIRDIAPSLTVCDQRMKSVDGTIQTIALTLIIIETKRSKGPVKIPSERTTGILSNSQ